MKEQLVAAFDAVCQGFSADRIVADPVLNADFIRECRRAELSDPPAALNRALLNLRKRGLLSGRKSKRTAFANEGDYRFAAEMAVRFLERRDGVSLDEIICDPPRAEEFDRLASRLAPGYTELQYRWAALNLRKTRRLQPELLAKVVPIVNVEQFRVDQLNPKAVPKQQGLYLFYTKSAALYVGESENLRHRIAKHLEHSDNKGLAEWIWKFGKELLHLELHALPPATPTRIRKALEVELIRSRCPLFNLKR